MSCTMDKGASHNSTYLRRSKLTTLGKNLMNEWSYLPNANLYEEIEGRNDIDHGALGNDVLAFSFKNDLYI